MTGPYLKNIIINHRLSLKISAEKLGMSIREFEEHLSNENLEEKVSLFIWETLGLRHLVPAGTGISKADLEYQNEMKRINSRLLKANKELICVIVKNKETIALQIQKLEISENIINNLEQKLNYYLTENVKLENEIKILKKNK